MTAEDHYYTGLDLFGAGKFEEAIAQYRSALALNPNFTDAFHGLAQVYLARNDFDGAIAAAQQVLELDSGDILAWTTLSRAYQRKGMITEAKHAGEEAQTLGSKRQFREQNRKEEDS